MPRKCFIILLAFAFLALGTGAATVIHHDEAHAAVGDSHCQICIVLMTAAVALVLTGLMLLFSVTTSPWPEGLAARVQLLGQFRFAPLSARPPPVR